MANENLDVIAELRALLARLEGAAPVANAAPAAPTQTYMTTAEFAEHRRVSVSTVKRWLRFGLPHAKMGRVVRVRVAEADRWVEGDGPRQAIEAAAKKVA